MFQRKDKNLVDSRSKNQNCPKTDGRCLALSAQAKKLRNDVLLRFFHFNIVTSARKDVPSLSKWIVSLILIN